MQREFPAGVLAELLNERAEAEVIVEVLELLPPAQIERSPLLLALYLRARVLCQDPGPTG